MAPYILIFLNQTWIVPQAQSTTMTIDCTKISLCLECKNLSKIFLTRSFSMKLNQSMHNKI
jgi:hypothetical protein